MKHHKTWATQTKYKNCVIHTGGTAKKNYRCARKARFPQELSIKQTLLINNDPVIYWCTANTKYKFFAVTILWLEFFLKKYGVISRTPVPLKKEDILEAKHLLLSTVKAQETWVVKAK